MEIKVLSVLNDNRINCISVLTEIKTSEYLESIKSDNKISGQRDVLKTSTAVTIRKRMIDDLKEGAIIPPIVLGLIIESISVADIQSNQDAIIKCINANIGSDNLSIIDGMQRTESLRQAISLNPEIKERYLRIEFWMSNNVSSLIYRMLVLNTGQVPWTTRRQIEIIHKPLISEVEKKVPGIVLNQIDDNARRKSAGEYPASSIVELYMVYGARKEYIDTKEKLADDFNRLDIINLSSNVAYTNHFYKAIKILFDFDNAISKFQPEITDSRIRFSYGKDLFTSMPAKVGFIVSIAKYVIGRPGGIERSEDEQEKRINDLDEQCKGLIEKITALEGKDLVNFISFDILAEKIRSLPTQKIGDAERDFFVKAFSALIDAKFDISSLNEAWLAY